VLGLQRCRLRSRFIVCRQKQEQAFALWLSEAWKLQNYEIMALSMDGKIVPSMILLYVRCAAHNKERRLFAVLLGEWGGWPVDSRVELRSTKTEDTVKMEETIGRLYSVKNVVVLWLIVELFCCKKTRGRILVLVVMLAGENKVGSKTLLLVWQDKSSSEVRLRSRVARL
jgi:hypothetical protein